mgnify:CR=1 FL=1
MGRGGVSPSHFFYEMTFSEAAAFIRGLERRDRQTWEQTRIIASAFGAKFKFPWDDEENHTEIDKNEIKDLRERIKKVKL